MPGVISELEEAIWRPLSTERKEVRREGGIRNRQDPAQALSHPTALQPKREHTHWPALAQTN